LLVVEWSQEDVAVFNDMALHLLQSAQDQPYCVVHRDFHSRNIMVTGEQLALIDFQDALWGPAVYDVVSLLKDCYVQWPRDRQLQWLRYYWQQTPGSAHTPFEAVVKQFDLIGLQRHIKVLGIFARLFLRDGKAGYLTDLPLVIRYTLEAAALYPETAPFADWFEQTLMPRVKQQAWYTA